MERLKQAYEERGETLNLGGARITLYASLEIGLTNPNLGEQVSAALQNRNEVDQITTRQADYGKLLNIIGVIRTAGIAAVDAVYPAAVMPGSEGPSHLCDS